MTQTMNDIAAKSLGDSTSYAVYTDKFDASLLNPMPRNIAREGWGIKGDEFVGADVWHCHEATFLLNNGLPVAGTLKFIYSAGSEFMVESKSAKLYLNSFDMCKMGETFYEAVSNYENQITNDLEAILKCDVQVRFFGSADFRPVPSYFPYNNVVDLLGPSVLETVQFTDYSGKENHISFELPHLSDYMPVRMYTNILRSRCRHTRQKDTGSAFISVVSQTKKVSPLSVLKQVVSLREVNEFHEFCAEKLYVEILKSAPSDVKTSVALLYSRRGSLDINPVRATDIETLNKENAELLNINTLTFKTQGQ